MEVLFNDTERKPLVRPANSCDVSLDMFEGRHISTFPEEERGEVLKIMIDSVKALNPPPTEASISESGIYVRWDFPVPVPVNSFDDQGIIEYNIMKLIEFNTPCSTSDQMVAGIRPIPVSHEEKRAMTFFQAIGLKATYELKKITP